MDFIAIDSVDGSDYAVVDMDTGTILGTNLRLVRVSDIPAEQWNDAQDSDSEAFEVGREYGQDIYVTDDF